MRRIRAEDLALSMRRSFAESLVKVLLHFADGHWSNLLGNIYCNAEGKSKQRM